MGKIRRDRQLTGAGLTVDAGTLKDLASFAAGTEAVAFDLEGSVGLCFVGLRCTDLSLATGLAVHRLARFDRRAAGRQTVDADLRTRHRAPRGET